MSSLTSKIVLVMQKTYIIQVHLASLVIKNANICGADELQACAAMHVSVCGKF